MLKDKEWKWSHIIQVAQKQNVDAKTGCFSEYNKRLIAEKRYFADPAAWKKKLHFNQKSNNNGINFSVFFYVDPSFSLLLLYEPIGSSLSKNSDVHLTFDDAIFREKSPWDITDFDNKWTRTVRSPWKKLLSWYFFNTMRPLSNTK